MHVIIADGEGEEERERGKVERRVVRDWILWRRREGGSVLVEGVVVAAVAEVVVVMNGENGERGIVGDGPFFSFLMDEFGIWRVWRCLLDGVRHVAVLVNLKWLLRGFERGGAGEGNGY